MKRSSAQSAYRRTSVVYGHRTLREIQKAEGRKPVQPSQAHIERPASSSLSARELEEAKQQAAKFLRK